MSYDCSTLDAYQDIYAPSFVPSRVSFCIADHCNRSLRLVQVPFPSTFNSRLIVELTRSPAVSSSSSSSPSTHSASPISYLPALTGVVELLLFRGQLRISSPWTAHARFPMLLIISDETIAVGPLATRRNLHHSFIYASFGSNPVLESFHSLLIFYSRREPDTIVVDILCSIKDCLFYLFRYFQGPLIMHFDCSEMIYCEILLFRSFPPAAARFGLSFCPPFGTGRLLFLIPGDEYYRRLDL